MGHSYYRRPPAAASLGMTRLLIGLGVLGLLVVAGIIIYQLTKDTTTKQTVADNDTTYTKPKSKEKPKTPEDNDATYRLPIPKQEPPVPPEPPRPPKSVDPEVGDWAEYRNLQNGAVKSTEKVTIVAHEGVNYRIRIELVFNGKARPAVELLQPTNKALKQKELPTVGTVNKTTTTLLAQGNANVRMNGEAVACRTSHFRDTQSFTLDGKGELVNESLYWFCPQVPFGGFVREERNTIIFNGKPTTVTVTELVRYSRGGKVVTVEPPPRPTTPGGTLVERTKWVHDKGLFEMVRPGEWEETAPNGARNKFKESTRTPQYVELDDVKGASRVRLYADRCDVSFRPFTETRTFYRGKWEK